MRERDLSLPQLDRLMDDLCAPTPGHGCTEDEMAGLVHLVGQALDEYTTGTAALPEFGA